MTVATILSNAVRGTVREIELCVLFWITLPAREASEAYTSRGSTTNGNLRDLFVAPHATKPQFPA